MTEFIASSIVAIIGILMGMWVHNTISSSRYKDIENQYKQRVGELERNVCTMREMYDDMHEDRDEWKNRATRDDVSDAFVACYKLETYEKLLNKLLGDPTVHNDEFVVMDGRAYVIRSYTLDHNHGEADTLTVECVQFDIHDRHLKGEKT
jgi:hypothetical protein